MKFRYGWNSRYPEPDYWDTRTPLYIGTPKFFQLYQDLNAKKLRVFLKGLNGKILDAGCGDGRFIEYADLGVDFSKGMLKRAKSRHKTKAFVRASILSLPFRNKIFSASFTMAILLHIEPEKRKNALKELDRVADNSYNFLSEDLTLAPLMLALLRKSPFKYLSQAIPYIAVFLAFPFDRVKKLEIDSSNSVLKKLSYTYM